MPPRRVGSFFIWRPASPGVCGGGAAPMVKTGVPVGGRAAGAANGDGVEAGTELGAPNVNPVAPFCPGSAEFVAAGDAG